MTRSISVIEKSEKKRGRPKTGIGPAVGLRLYPELEARLDVWIAKQNEPELGRPEAIRRVLDETLPPLPKHAAVKPPVVPVHASKPAPAPKAAPATKTRQRRP